MALFVVSDQILAALSQGGLAPAAGEAAAGSWWQAIPGLLKANWQLFVGGGVIGTAFGAWVKHLLDQRSARLAARRQFWQQVTDRIAALAKESYWALANHAAVVAGELTEYCRERDLQLMLYPYDHGRLKGELEALVSEERKETAFFYFCRLIKHVDDFQFEKSNAYLLRHHWAGRRAVQLYNVFITAVTRPPGGNATGIDTGIDTFAILLAFAKSAPYPEAADKQPAGREAVSGITLDEYRRAEEELAEPKEQFAAWLRNHPALVLTAAEALSAYSELLSQELANLYRDWFQPRGRWRRLDWRRSLIRSVAAERWPDVISEPSFRTIDRASVAEPLLLRPIGRKRTPPKRARHQEIAPEAERRREAKPQPAEPPRRETSKDTGEIRRRGQDNKEQEPAVGREEPPG